MSLVSKISYYKQLIFEASLKGLEMKTVPVCTVCEL